MPGRDGLLTWRHSQAWTLPMSVLLLFVSVTRMIRSLAVRAECFLTTFGCVGYYRSQNRHRKHLVDSRMPGLSETVVGKRIDLRLPIFDLRFISRCPLCSLWPEESAFISVNQRLFHLSFRESCTQWLLTEIYLEYAWFLEIIEYNTQQIRISYVVMSRKAIIGFEIASLRSQWQNLAWRSLKRTKQ